MQQYYIKIFNCKNNNIVGYYKEKGITNISKLKKGIKYWDNEKDALSTCFILDNNFIRDQDGHYYTCHSVVMCETVEKQKVKPAYVIQSEEERNNEVEAFIRQNNYRIKE